MKDKIPNTNNGGEGKRGHALTPESVIKRSDYYFRLHVLRRFMKPGELSEFVNRYCQHRGFKHVFEPSKKQLSIYELYRKGELSLAEAAKGWGFDKAFQAYNLLGRIQAYVIEQEANRNHK